MQEGSESEPEDAKDSDGDPIHKQKVQTWKAPVLDSDMLDSELENSKSIVTDDARI